MPCVTKHTYIVGAYPALRVQILGLRVRSAETDQSLTNRAVYIPIQWIELIHAIQPVSWVDLIESIHFLITNCDRVDRLD